MEDKLGNPIESGDKQIDVVVKDGKPTNVAIPPLKAAEDTSETVVVKPLPEPKILQVQVPQPKGLKVEVIEGHKPDDELVKEEFVYDDAHPWNEKQPQAYPAGATTGAYGKPSWKCTSPRGNPKECVNTTKAFCKKAGGVWVEGEGSSSGD